MTNLFTSFRPSQCGNSWTVQDDWKQALLSDRCELPSPNKDPFNNPQGQACHRLLLTDDENPQSEQFTIKRVIIEFTYKKLGLKTSAMTPLVTLNTKTNNR